ncbi:hypothetical protein CLAFUW4_13710 [Fulvia fulva]|uniref:DUF1279 domain-containing protein n=1 Tax=Passalora fulva TaxID=5499 RepID=A0A9Q8PLT0_PASFU|nr:uncharacterized protein CLAFUR5_13559 [Fulvia fulva]KAK4610383.1 hypothetical protein CLAFUR4_13713 [Fulvia fulva]KAK4611077.1 hypothetical protein CLAFUR0_13717 [Fulvia fulva]UJO24782.1 hypothetical protein CLAFUR5_13559 [Fulvia fulva]WPV22184.1 hypothetical protein CLAFUW4_13710 [Fulvia fulva]WPV36851.1 hypothetical protein CLAFUW7_13718 [Fulvia fulva]
MLRTTRLTQVFRQTPLHEVLSRASVRRNAAQLPKLPAKTTPRRDFATSNLRLTNSQRLIRAWRQPAFRSGRQARYNSTKTSAEEELGSNAPQSLSERMKAMSRKYGWIVVGIYLGLSVLDFPFCFLAVRWFGTERIANLEHAIIDGFWSQVEKFAPSLKEKREAKEAIAAAEEAAREGSDAVMKEAKKEGDASIWTQLLLAYGVHKSLIFFRIPITLAITPKVVKTLRKWGWNIGKPKPK